MYRYILFDLDGTLTDSREGIVHCVRETILGYGGPVPEEETLLRFIGPPLQDSFARFCGYSPEKAAEAVEEAAKDGPYLSKDDFRQRTKVSKTVIDLMGELGLLGDLPESNQLSLFDF